MLGIGRRGNSTLCYIVRDNRGIGCLLDREGYFLSGWRGVSLLPLEIAGTMSGRFDRTSGSAYRTAWIEIDRRKLQRLLQSETDLNRSERPAPREEN